MQAVGCRTEGQSEHHPKYRLVGEDEVVDAPELHSGILSLTQICQSRQPQNDYISTNAVTKTGWG
jgi:hypothetical protein